MLALAAAGPGEIEIKIRIAQVRKRTRAESSREAETKLGRGGADGGVNERVHDRTTVHIRSPDVNVKISLHKMLTFWKRFDARPSA